MTNTAMSGLSGLSALCGAVRLGYDAVILADSPAHYYTCEEASGTIIDRVGSLNGTSAAVTYAQASILPVSDSKTCILSGVGGSVGFSANMGGYPKSFEIWWKPTSVTSPNLEMFWQNGGGSDGVNFSFLASGLNWLGLFLNGASVVARTAWVPVVGTTYLLLCTTDGTAAGTKIYINGLLQTMTTGSAASVPSTANSSILGSALSTAGALGYCEKAAVFNYVLTQAQATAHYAAAN